MKFGLHNECFGIKQAPGRKKSVEPEFQEFDAPDTLIKDRLIKYMDHRLAKGDPLTIPQLEALLELLTEADHFGHDINRLLLNATANGWRQVVYDNHLRPKVS